MVQKSYHHSHRDTYTLTLFSQCIYFKVSYETAASSKLIHYFESLTLSQVKKKLPHFQASTQNRSIEHVLKQKSHIVSCWSLIWTRSAIANGLKQTPYCDEHNRVASKLQVVEAHSDSIKKEKLHKATIFILFCNYFKFFLLDVGDKTKIYHKNPLGTFLNPWAAKDQASYTTNHLKKKKTVHNVDFFLKKC